MSINNKVSKTGAEMLASVKAEIAAKVKAEALAMEISEKAEAEAALKRAEAVRAEAGKDGMIVRALPQSIREQEVALKSLAHDYIQNKTLLRALYGSKVPYISSKAIRKVSTGSETYAVIRFPNL